ncbi:MAG: DHH family phosphoesterase, partial [Candidatus Bathyarchaeia archaeon]
MPQSSKEAPEKDRRSLIDRARLLGERIREDAAKGLRFLILSHFDADGLAAAGIMARTLLRLGAAFHVRILKELNEETLEGVSSIPYERIIFSELGSGYLDLISASHGLGSVYIIDHHPVLGDPSLFSNHFNPNLFGYDGAKELSGSGSVYLVSREISSGNVDLSPLAVVGALGDVQDKNERRELTSLNAEIVQEAREAGYLKAEPDLIFYGRETRPVYKALANTTNPFLPGLSGREDNCLSLL